MFLLLPLFFSFFLSLQLEELCLSWVSNSSVCQSWGWAHMSVQQTLQSGKLMPGLRQGRLLREYNRDSMCHSCPEDTRWRDQIHPCLLPFVANRRQSRIDSVSISKKFRAMSGVCWRQSRTWDELLCPEKWLRAVICQLSVAAERSFQGEQPVSSKVVPHRISELVFPYANTTGAKTRLVCQCICCKHVPIL